MTQQDFKEYITGTRISLSIVYLDITIEDHSEMTKSERAQRP